MTPRQLKALATRPADLSRYLATGKLPTERSAPNSPLIDLLVQIGPRHLPHIKGLRIGPELGYRGSRTFQSAAQALLWLRPPHAGPSHPAESWRDARFAKKLHLDELALCCAPLPQSITDSLTHLARPQSASAPEPASSEPLPARGAQP